MILHIKKLPDIVIVLLIAKIVAIYFTALTLPLFLNFLDEDKTLKDFYPYTYRLGHEENIIFSGLCCHWDSEHYLDIGKEGYSKTHLYAFAPLYPFMIRLLSIILDSRLAAILISNVFSIFAVVMFYKVALLYLKRENALLATLVFSFFPTNFVYGTVAYTEPIFLTFSLLSWYLFEKRNYMGCGFFMLLASLARYVGLLLFPLMLLIYIWRTKDKKILPLAKMNVFIVGVIIWFLKIPISRVVDAQKYFSSDKTVTYPFRYLIHGAPTGDALHAFFYIVFIGSLSLILIRVKPTLSIYSITFILFYNSFTSQAGESIPRYLGAVWPAYLSLPLLRSLLRNRYLLSTMFFFFYTWSITILLIHFSWIWYS